MSKGLRTIVGVALVVLAIWQPEFAPWIAAHAFAVGAFGASLALGAVLQPKLKTLQRLQSQSVMMRSAIQAQEILFGRDRKSGVLPYWGTSGSENEYLWYVVAVVEHEIDGYETLWIDDVAIDIATEIDGSGFVTSAAFVDADGNKLVKTKFYTGLDTQTVDTDLQAAFSEWDSDHAGEGVAYFWVRMQLDRSDGGTDPENPAANVWHKGYPQNVSVTARGVKVYDPRLDSTNGGTGSHRVDDETTWEWSQNAVLGRVYYLMSSRFGPGYLSTEIDWTIVAAQADIADELTSIPGSETQARYTLNGIVIVDDDPKSIIEDMQTADHGVTLFLPTTIEVRVGAWEASSHTIDETWLVGGITAESAVATDDTYNAVRGQYLSAAEDYSIIEFQPRLAAAYETEDGIGRIYEDVMLPYVREEYHAQRMAIIQLKKSRQQITVRGKFNFRALLVQPYQIVTLNVGGFSGDTFRVLGKVESADGTVTLQLREEVEDDWSYTIPDLAEPPVIPSVVRNPDGAPPCTALAAITAAGGIHVVWANPSLSQISHVELYSADSDDRSGAVLAFKGKVLEYFDFQDEGTVKYYWVVSRGNNGLLSTWYPVSSTAGVEGTAGAVTIGESAINAQLTNPSGQVTADTNGLGYDLSNAGGTFEVWEGTSNVTGIAGVDGPTYYVLDEHLIGDPVSNVTFNGLNLAIDEDTGVYTLTDDSAWVCPAGNIGNAYTLRAVYKGFNFDRGYTIIKSLSGKSLTLTATQQAFAYDTAGDLKGADEIFFTADQKNSTATVVWVTQKWNGVDDFENTTVNRMTSSTGLTNSLTESAFAAESETALRVWCHFQDPTGQYYIDTLTIQKLEDGAPGADGADAVHYYIKPTNGTAIKNGTGTLTVEAHMVAGGVDSLLSSGTIKLYVSTTEVTVANGYATGSDGYTGVFDSGDISDNVVVILKDGSGGTVLDTITLVDIADGAAGGDGSNAVSGYVEPSAPISWTRAADQSTWTPSGTTVDLDCTFVQGGSAVARKAWRITRASNGILTGASTTHKDGDLNTSRVTVTELNESSQAFTIKFDYSNSGDLASVSETVITSMAGANGSNGSDGSDGANGVSAHLTNPTPVLPTNSDGDNVNLLGVDAIYGTIDYALEGANGTFEILDGATDATSSTTFSIVGGTGTNPSYLVQNNLLFLIFSTGTYKGKYTVRQSSNNPALWTTDTESVTIRANYGGVNYDRTYTVTKAKAGVNGGSGGAAGDVDLQSRSSNAGTGTTTQGFRVHSDGTVDATTVSSGTYTNQYTWLNSGLNSDYEVKMTKVSGLTLTSGTLDTWQACSTTRTWYRTAASGSWVGQLSIRRASDGAILDTCTVELDNVTA